jgi:hypothetical protein
MSRLSLVNFLAGLVLMLGADPAHAAAKGFKVTTDRSIDSSSLETIVKQVIARSGARTNDEKAIALYEYLHHTIFHYAYAGEPSPQTIGPLKLINVYGWSLCGGQHTVLKALYETAGWECRYVGWSDPGHTTIEVKYDGRWHYFDVFLKCYFWSKDKKYVVSQEEIATNPSLVLDAVKEKRAAREHLCCGDTAAGVISGCKSRRVAGNVKGWGACQWRDQGYAPVLTLPAGAALRLDWKGEPGGYAVSGRAPIHTCGNKDFRHDPILGPLAEHYGPRGFSTGTLTYAPDFTRAADLADIERTRVKAEGGKLIASGKGTAVFKLALPYVFVRARAQARYQGGDGKLSVSTDGGKTWKPVKGDDLTALVKQRYDVWVKTEFTGSLTAFRVEAGVEHNRGALPYLVTGKNTVTVSLDKNELPRNTLLKVTFSYQEATVANPKKRDRFDGRGVTYGPVKTVTKEITRLPGTFTIEVGGNTPPKMISLERSVQGR